MKTIHGRLILVAALVLAATAAIYAGGWSIITLNDFPDRVVAGESLTLTFSVRQHGIHLITGLKPTIQAETAGGLKAVTVANPTSNKGEYSATLRLATPGAWTIRVDGGFNPEDRARQYNTLILPPLAVVRDVSAPRTTYSAADHGGRLFVAKGCVGCHKPGSEQDLTGKAFKTDYVKRFLADPSIRTADMPNLRLKESEISALTAFITRPSTEVPPSRLATSR